LENKNQRSKLYIKETRKKTARENVNPGGKAIEATGDACMEAIAAGKMDKAAEIARKSARGNRRAPRGSTSGMGPTEIARRKVLFQEAVRMWKARREELGQLGRYKNEAGNEPRLYWFMEAEDPDSVMELHVGCSTPIPTTSHPCCNRACRQHLANPTSDHENDRDYVEGNSNCF